MDFHERDRIGVVIHVKSSEYPQIVEKWSFDLPKDYVTSLEALIKCKYAVFAVDGKLKSVAVIESWTLQIGDEKSRKAKISSVSERVSSLSSVFRNDLSETLWLNESQAKEAESDLAGHRKDRPEALRPCLDLEEASSAVAARYGVRPEQVRISIHRATVVNTPDD